MAKRSMEYAHAAYLVPQITQADIIATTVYQAGRFAAWTSMIAKSAQVTVITAGTDTVIPTIQFRQVNGTTTSTLGSVNMSTNAAFYTTNVLLTGTLAVGDIFMAVKGADATAVFAIGVEWLIAPGANVTV